MSASLFEQFRKNLAVMTQDSIATSYGEITKRLNRDFWDSESDASHSLQVGSYGRQTAIRDVSDLDMVFELPQAVFERLSKIEGNGPSQLLQEVRASILQRYPRTDVRGDGQVVTVEFDKYVVEVLPSFVQADGGFRYGDTHNGGTWNNYCWPRDEIAAVNTINSGCNRNLKRAAKMVRAWKNTHGAPMSGMLIDTLVYNFFAGNSDYNESSYGDYPELVRDLLTFLANQPEQAYWLSELFFGYIDRILSTAIKDCHGTLIAVVPKEMTVLPETLADSVVLNPPLHLYERFKRHIDEGKTAASVSRLQAASELVSGFIGSDGITVFSDAGYVLGYRAFVHSETGGKPVAGGARSRAFETMKALVGTDLAAAFFRSQDGRTEYVHAAMEELK